VPEERSKRGASLEQGKTQYIVVLRGGRKVLGANLVEAKLHALIQRNLVANLRLAHIDQRCSTGLNAGLQHHLVSGPVCGDDIHVRVIQGEAVDD
jgi:hypothetical protein